MRTLFSPELMCEAEALVRNLDAHGAFITCAESCTGGLISGLITSLPGSSRVFATGYVSYSNDAKMRLLGVTHDVLDAKGAVSSEVAAAMAAGALREAGAALSVAVTGIAGPDGGTAAKPVGLVYIGTAVAGATPEVKEYRFGPIGRDAIRLATVRAAIDQAQEVLKQIIPAKPG